MAIALHRGLAIPVWSVALWAAALSEPRMSLLLMLAAASSMMLLLMRPLRATLVPAPVTITGGTKR